MNHEHWMRHACMLARRGTGHVSPNPRVGAVVVRNNQIVAEGWHKVFGGPHAEANALAAFDGIIDGATLYVTLEPCSHIGKQPACTTAILASGIQTVVVGMHDPNPNVQGGGIEFLRQHGITVITDVCREECMWINRFFTTWVAQHRSYVIGKIATTADGCARATTHGGRWITSLASRTRVHDLRAEVDCVLSGIGTVLADDPLFTVRHVDGRNPARAILDTTCSMPPSTAIAQSAREIPTYIFCSNDASQSSEAQALRASGCIVVPSLVINDRLDLGNVMTTLASFGFTSVMVESGPTLMQAMVQHGILDEIEIHTGIGQGDASCIWDPVCVSPDPHQYVQHSVARCDGDTHTVYTRSLA